MPETSSKSAAPASPSPRRHLPVERPAMATCSVLLVALVGILTGQLVFVMTQPSVTPDPGPDNITMNPALMDETELRWNTWTEWSECTASCAGGQQLRLKVCSAEEDVNCTMMLQTEDSEKVGYRIQWGDCNTQPCPIHGGWSAFGNWSECSATCDQGYQRRDRSCTDPEPQYDGNECPGEPFEHRFCEMDECPKEERSEPLIPEETFTEADKRPSAISIGSLGLGLVAGIMGMLICLDAATLGRHCSLAKRNIRAAKPSRKTSPSSSSSSLQSLRRRPSVMPLTPKTY